MLTYLLTYCMPDIHEERCLSTQEGNNRALRELLVADTVLYDPQCGSRANHFGSRANIASILKIAQNL